jgi:tetratricopeptide (TPR) repeat protein
VQIIEHALSDVTPAPTTLPPVAAFEAESGWLSRLRKAGLGPILADLARLTPQSRGGAAIDRLFGPLARVTILIETGRLDAALGVAAQVTPRDAEVDDAVARIKGELAARRCEVGEIEEAVRLASEAGAHGREATAGIARAIDRKLVRQEPERAMYLLERLLALDPQRREIRVPLAGLLERRAGLNLKNDGPIEVSMADLARGVQLDPDDRDLRSGLAVTHVLRAGSTWKQQPVAALSDLQRAHSIDPGLRLLHENGAELALAIAMTFWERRDRPGARSAIDLAYQLDPDDPYVRVAYRQMV